MSKFSHIVTEEDAGLAVKSIIRCRFTFSSRLKTKLKKNNLVYLNGKPIEGWKTPAVGDVITVELPEERSDFEPEQITILPVYEDDDLLVINKQPGYVVHPTKGQPAHTMANGVMQYMIDTNQSFKIRFVNRLDRDTSGLLIVAKNSYSQEELTKQMKQNIVKKRYNAVVKGIIEEDSGTIDLPIGRPDLDHVQRGVMAEGGHESVTHFKVIERYAKESQGYTLIELLLETGRTHQIRVHMSHIGHPVIGDNLYGGENVLLIERQALHARYLSFNHPVTGKPMEVEAPLPEDIEKLIKKISK